MDKMKKMMAMFLGMLMLALMAAGCGQSSPPGKTDTKPAAVSRIDQIKAAADAVDRGHGVVVVTDMFGGSPSNLSLPACAARNRRILYGANLPMLIKLTKSRDLPLAEAVMLALDAGRKYINSLDLGGDMPTDPRGQA